MRGVVDEHIHFVGMIEGRIDVGNEGTELEVIKEGGVELKESPGSLMGIGSDKKGRLGVVDRVGVEKNLF